MTTPQGMQSADVAFAGTMARILVSGAQTGGAFALLRIANPPGRKTPPHVHRHEQETVFMLSGVLRAESGGVTVDVAAGESLTLPRGRAHRLGNASAFPADCLLLCTPAGFEDFVREAGRPACRAPPDLGDAGLTQMTEADIARLVAAAPRYGITLVDEAALSAPTPAGEKPIARHAAAETVDIIGPTIEVVAELGEGAEAACLIKGALPSGAFVPLHSCADREAFLVVSGELEVFSETDGWSTLPAGDVVVFPGETRHALWNRGRDPSAIVLVTTRRRANFLSELGSAMAALPAGASLADRIETRERLAARYGCWQADANDNARIGLPIDEPGKRQA